MGLFDRFRGRKIEEKPAKEVNVHYHTFLDQGKIELESKDYGKAAEYFDKALAEGGRTDEQLERAYAYKARALDGLKKYEDSGRLYDKAFQLKPDDAYTWFLRGLSYMEQGMNEKAVKYYDKSFELNSMLEDAMLAKAMLYTRLGQRDKEIECYQRILQANPESRKAQQFMQKITDEEKSRTNKQWLEGITKRMTLNDEGIKDLLDSKEEK